MNNTPPVTKNLIIINALCFFATMVVNRRFGIDLNDVLGLYFFKSHDFNLFQFFTYLCMHGDFTHLFFNMFTLWMFGRVLETVWGSQRFLFFYIFCGIGAGVVQEIVQTIPSLPILHDMRLLEAYPPSEIVPIGGASYTASQWLTLLYNRLPLHPVVGASGAIYAILLAFGMLFPNQPMYIIPFPMPIKAKWMIVGYVVLELYLGMNVHDRIAHFAHLGGMLFGFLLIMYWKKKGTFHGRYF